MNVHSKWLSLAISLGVILSMALLGFATTARASAPAKRAASTHSSKSSSAIPVRCKTHNKAKGTYTYSDNQFPDNVSPYQGDLVVDFETADLTQDSPLNWNDKAKLYADYLTVIPSVRNGGVTNGGKTFTFHLKPGMRWSDGTQITVKDWVFGWKVQSDAATGPACLGTCDVISRLDTSGKYTAIMHLKRIDASFLTGGHYPALIPTSWAGGAAPWSNNPHDAAEALYVNTSENFEGPSYPTSGPYQVQTFVTNDRIVSTPMKYYDILSCGGYIKNMVFSFYSDPAGEIAAAATKATDLTQDYTFSNLQELNSHKAYKTYVIPGFEIEHLELNQDPTYNGSPNPLHNVKVRQAMALAVNKVSDLQSAFGISKKVAQSLVAYSFLVDTKALRAPFADPALQGAWDPLAKKYLPAGSSQAVKDAKKLLQQAGFGSGFSLDFDTTPAPYRVAEMAAISKSFEDIGIKVTQNAIPASKFFGQYNEGGTLALGKFQVGLFTWSVSPDPDGQKAFFEARYIDREQTAHNPGNQNFSGVHDPAITADFTKADATVNNALRTKYYYDAQKRVVDNADWISFYFRPVIASEDGRNKAFLMNPTSAGLAWNAPVWRLSAAR